MKEVITNLLVCAIRDRSLGHKVFHLKTLSGLLSEEINLRKDKDLKKRLIKAIRKIETAEKLAIQSQYGPLTPNNLLSFTQNITEATTELIILANKLGLLDERIFSISIPFEVESYGKSSTGKQKNPFNLSPESL